MQREEKIVDAVLDNLILRLADLKNSMQALLQQIEHGTLTWPTALNNFMLFSGQMKTILKIMKNEKTPILRNMTTMPIHITQSADHELMNLTEGRVHVFNHEIVPDYLRTKADLDVEAREQQLIQKCNQMPVDADCEVAESNDICDNILELIRAAREDSDGKSGARASTEQTSSSLDTNLLVSVVCLGKGMDGQVEMAPTQIAGIVKVPSAIKTNKKFEVSIHPYRK